MTPTPFKEIPDESFDSFSENLQKTNKEREGKKFPLKDPEESIFKGSLEGLKVKSIDIQNIRNISYINETFSDFVIVWGNNAQGKSSFIDSIFLAIQWSKFADTTNAKVIKHWEDKAEISLLLEWEETKIFLYRKFSKWTAKNPAWTSTIEMSINWEEGKKLSQKQLDSLINILTIDPLGIEKIIDSKWIPESIRMIQVMTWLDLTEINKEIKSIEEEQKEANWYLKTIQWAVESYWFSQKIEKVDINELLKISEEFSGNELKGFEVSRIWQNFQSKKAEVEELKVKLLKAEWELETLRSDWKIKREEFLKEKEFLESKLWGNQNKDFWGSNK